jgi:sterol desaturase/sphingolipid hydroxylase (fatty acid hydroxylase superfamily)
VLGGHRGAAGVRNGGVFRAAVTPLRPSRGRHAAVAPLVRGRARVGTWWRITANVATSLAAVAFAVWTRPALLGGLVIAALLAASVEVLLPLHPSRRSRAAWVTDLTCAIGNRSLIVPILAGMLYVLGPAAHWITPEAVRRALDATPGWSRFLVVFLASDLCNYAAHRALHTVPWFWRLHRVHHASERVDWLATSRGHPLDQALNIAVAVLPFYAVGDVAYAPYLIAFLYLYPFLLHADARLRTGVLRWLLVTPEFHHWHHADQPEAYNRNFGAILSIWDHLFGTAHGSKGFPNTYGIGSPALANSDYLGQLLSPLARLSNSAG